MGKELLNSETVRRRRELLHDPHVSLARFPRIISDAEHKALIGAARGEMVEQTARRLDLSVDTVKTQRSMALRRMGVATVAQAVGLAVMAGWITEEDIKKKRREDQVARWQFDADRSDPLTARRIPVTSNEPMWGYFVAFDKASPRRPAEADVRAIQSFIAETRRDWEMLMREAGIAHHPFDWFPGYNTVVLHKYAARDWGYRTRLRSGRSLYPPPPERRTRAHRPKTLVEVMDLVRTNPHTGRVSEEWVLWKMRHPEVFGEFEA